MKPKLLLIHSALFALAGFGISTDKVGTPLVHSAVVAAPVKDVWAAYTTVEGITSWMVQSASIEMRIGGIRRTSYTKGSDLRGADTIELKIISFDPEKMISMQCVKAPEKFPFKAALYNAWVNLYFEPVGTNKTKVVCRMLGFTESADSVELRKFFESGNQIELDALVKYFKK